MYYVVNVDHHGLFQGIRAGFATFEDAQIFQIHAYSDIGSEPAQSIGCVCYLSGYYASVIFKHKLILTPDGGGLQHPDITRHSSPLERDFVAKLDKLLGLLEDNNKIFTDWRDTFDKDIGHEEQFKVGMKVKVRLDNSENFRTAWKPATIVKIEEEDLVFTVVLEDMTEHETILEYICI
jgi:hypothetical protein